MKENTNEKAMENIKVNVEIDYDKLAESIVKAHEIEKLRQEEKERELEEIEKKVSEEIDNGKISTKRIIRFLRKIMRGEIDTRGEITPAVMSLFTSWFAGIFSFVIKVLAWLLLVAAIIFAVDKMTWKNIQIFTNISALWLFLMIDIFLYFIACMMKVVSKDIEKSKDKHYVLSVFSALAGLGALLIAFIALIK